MSSSFFRNRMRRLFLTFSMLALAAPCYAGVIYETTFDNNSPWNTDGSLNGACASTTCSTGPTGWSNFYSLPPVGNLACVVNSIPDGSADHTGGTARKAYLAYYNNVQYSGGQELSKTFAQDYPELYARVWVKAQPGWKTASDSSIKLFRLGHWDRTGSAFAYFPTGNGAPLAGLNWATNSVYRSTNGVPDGCYITWGRFDPQETNYYPPGWPDAAQRLLPGVPPSGAGSFADGKWHRYDVHVKMNTLSGSTWNSDGIYEFSYDGKPIISYKNLKWLNSGSPTSTGWNSIQLGGNSSNPYSGTPQWAAFDDVVVSTTPIADTYVIGGATAPAPDTTAPSAAITAPTSGTSVTGTVSVTANATDNVGVTKVEFYVNGVLQATDTASPYLFSWNTSALAAGTYNLMAKAYDAAGNVGQSGNVAVTLVKDTTAPTVSLGSPVSGATLTGTATMTASASDNVAVTKVEFYANGSLLCASNVAPYSYNWNTASVADGSYTLLAKGYDAAGNVGQCSSIAVTVKNTTTTADATAPSLTAFTMPSTATSLSVPVSSLSGSDNVGVTGYLISESSTKPVASATGWTASVPTSFTFAGAGSRTAYAWAKDAAGNVSASRSVAVTITLPTASVPGLVAAYSFDEGTGTTVTDKSGNGNHGTVSYGTWSTGKYGSSLLFNGTSTKVVVPDSASLRVAAGMTVEAWVNPERVSSIMQDVVYKGNDNYFLDVTSTTSGKAYGGVAVSAGGYAKSYSAAAVPLYAWTHLAITYDGYTEKLYVGGVLVSSYAKTGTIATSTTPLEIGGNRYYGEYFAGRIDEVRVYNVALSQAQIQADMAKGIGL